MESDLGSGAPSDHGVVFCSVDLPRFQAFEWVSFSYMRQTDKGNDQFKSYKCPLPNLLPFQVAGKIKSIKKNCTKIRGDIFPTLVTEYTDLLALPLTEIYNTITETLLFLFYLFFF